DQGELGGDEEPVERDQGRHAQKFQHVPVPVGVGDRFGSDEHERRSLGPDEKLEMRRLCGPTAAVYSTALMPEPGRRSAAATELSTWQGFARESANRAALNGHPAAHIASSR